MVALKDVPPTPDAALLLPRRYQEEIFRRSQEDNVIAALDTGSGKTFISTLLIKWMSIQEHAQGKAILFLVPKVALVEQQGDFIATQTPLRVKKLRGSLEMDLTDRAKWREAFESADVLVMTAQIFTNILTHSHWSIDKISLIVFDECHHCRKNHAYNAIMREYYQIAPNLRPKIFGMTASPIWNPKDPEGSLGTLEKNLDAIAISVKEHIAELRDNSPRPVEIIKQFPEPLNEYVYLKVPLRQCLYMYMSSQEFDVPWEKICQRYIVTLLSIGPYGADLFLYQDFKQRIHNIIHQSRPPDPFVHEIKQHDIEMEDLSTPLAADVTEIDSILSEYQPFFADQSGDVPIPVPLHWCTPKLKVLVDTLRESAASSFQGIIFVEQRQVASCLAKILPQIPELQGLIRCAELVGHGGQNSGNMQARGMGLARQQDVVQSFRDKEINLLVATSVAEEGLDFPACDIVIRFDPLNHMVGYVQSRGRARNKTSTFVIMIQEGSDEALTRYKAFLNTEPELRKVYESRQKRARTIEEEEGDDTEDPSDLAERERYIVPSTGAVLTYNTSINLLNYLCSLIPHDNYTPTPVPKYSGDFISTLELPVSLPLPNEKLVYTGPEKLSKREAKRAVAFLAVKELHALDVFDDYLLPTSTSKGKVTEDADGRALLDIRKVPEAMTVDVRDPWVIRPTLWLHIITVDGRRAAGLITGSILPPIELIWEETNMRVFGTHMVRFQCDEEYIQRKLLNDYSKLCIWYCNTGRPFEVPLSCYVVPITNANQPDWKTIDSLVCRSYGSFDWSNITEKDYNRLLVMNTNEFGRSLILRNIRNDLTPMSTPPPGSRESAFPTYREFWIQKWTRKKRAAEVPTDGPLIEVTVLPRQSLGHYVRKGHGPLDLKGWAQSAVDTFLVPQGCCRWVDLPEDMYGLFHLLPRILHRATDVYRARQERFELGLPPMTDDWLVEASTLPTTDAGFNNQRLETLGDAVLKLAVTVHIFNKYPFRHEGQLSVLRQSSISNRTLLARAKEIGLEQFLTSESQSIHVWRYIGPEGVDPCTSGAPRYVQRQFPRRSLQDCMEATLGAAFMTCGMNMALRAGDALGLSFGGQQPWSVRYSRPSSKVPTPVLLLDLQESIGYEFHRGDLLVEAMTHPSFCSSENPSYQRLEFLGDAIIDIVVMKYLFDKFPQATSGQLSWARSRCVCAPALAAVAIKRLGMHKSALINNVALSSAINRYVPVMEAITFQDIVDKGWKHDPPKAISDVMESILGAVLVDSAWNFDVAATVTEFVLSDVLEVLTPTLRKDPVSDLMIWTSCSGCRRITFQKSQLNAESKRNDSVAILVHDVMVAGPVTAANLSLAKGLAAERARTVLEDPNSEHCLSRLCDCGKKMDVDAIVAAGSDVDIDLQRKSEVALNDETEEGFAKIAEMTRVEFEDPDLSTTITLVDETAIDEQAVEDMLAIQDQEFTSEADGDTASVGIPFAV